jgi:hypothetical protein
LEKAGAVLYLIDKIGNVDPAIATKMLKGETITINDS